MSLETWKQEFYPVPADSVPVEQAVDHSLRKWEGLRIQNLRKHGVKLKITNGPARITNGLFLLYINASTCALCKHHLSKECKTCPLAIARGGVRCDDYNPKSFDSNPYRIFMVSKNPEPMIALLKKAKELQK